MALGGIVRLPFGCSYREVLGGPFKDAPKEGYFLVKLTESHARADVELLIPDFGVPPSLGYTIRMVKQVLKLIAQDHKVYVGCVGGLGRTGLVLALLCKVMGSMDPVGYIRANYKPFAIETREQEDYVESFDFYGMYWFSLRMRLLAMWVDLKNKFKGV